MTPECVPKAGQNIPERIPKIDKTPIRMSGSYVLNRIVEEPPLGLKPYLLISEGVYGQLSLSDYLLSRTSYPSLSQTEILVNWTFRSLPSIFFSVS